MTLFRIRSRKTGLFSKGGSPGETRGWGKTGKLWKRAGDLNSHFTQLDSTGRNAYRKLDCEVQVIEVTETVQSVESVEEYLAAVEVRKQKKVREYQERMRHFEEEREKRQLLFLKEKYPNG